MGNEKDQGNVISKTLDYLLKYFSTNILDVLQIALNIGKPFITFGNQIIFDPDSEEKVIITFPNKSVKDNIVKNVINKFSINDKKLVINHIRHNFTHHLQDKKKSNLGKYYTSGHLVQLVIDLVKPYLKDKSIVIDLAAGCGAFIGHFDGYRTIGRDIDKDAVKILCALGFKNVDHDNSLLNVDRNKYGLSDEDHVVAVGNPPYNDVTSKNKKYGALSKEKVDVLIDRDIYSNDYGICFLKAFNKLKVDIICVLHPLSYLIKETNFSRLGVFTSNYHLKKAVIFSSREFLDTQKTPFPIIAALYLRGKGMSYEYLKNFQFDILNDDRKFILSNMETIDGYIRKYPPQKSDEHKSDIGLYMYNIRDTNSLLTSGNLTDKENKKIHITINSKDFFKYAYLNCMKRYFDKDFLFGNLSPIIEKDLLETDEYMRDLFIIDTIMNNQRIAAFDRNNAKNFISNYLPGYIVKDKKYFSNKPNIYALFIEFVNSGDFNLEITKTEIRQYFQLLKEKMLSGSTNTKPQNRKLLRKKTDTLELFPTDES